MVQLPNYRGPRKGPDKEVGQRESDLLRADVLPKYSGWGLSTLSHSYGQFSATTNYVMDDSRTLFLPLYLPTENITMDWAWINIQSLAAQSTNYVDTAIYLYAYDTKEMILVPGSLVRHYVTVAGKLRTKLTRPITIMANSMSLRDRIAFFAIRKVVSQLAVTIYAGNSSVTAQYPQRWKAWRGVDPFETRLKISSTTVSDTVVPHIDYVNQLMIDII